MLHGTDVDQEALLRDMVVRLVDALNPERTYLFGSRARGDANTDSDYDLLLVVSERVGPGREMELRANVALRGIGVPVDVVIVTADYFAWMLGAAASLPATVEREGRLLYPQEADRWVRQSRGQRPELPWVTQ
jgi:predicted nucleotidyltransferase